MEYLEYIKAAGDLLQKGQTGIALFIFSVIMLYSRYEVRAMEKSVEVKITEAVRNREEVTDDLEERLNLTEKRLEQMMRIHTERHKDDALLIWDLKGGNKPKRRNKNSDDSETE